MNYHRNIPPYHHNQSGGIPRPSSSGTLERDAKRHKPIAQHLYNYNTGAYSHAYYPYDYQQTSPGSFYQIPYGQQQPYFTPSYQQNAPVATPQWSADMYEEHSENKTDEGIPQGSKTIETYKKDTHVPQADHTIEEEEEEEEEKAQSNVTAIPSVPGTSIRLENDEDIKKWREQRRKMWLLKISNNKTKHMEEMGLSETDLKGQKSVLQEARKQKQFIQGIQNQISRTAPKANLNIKLVQRQMADENAKLLDFIRELGDATLLEYELTKEEKDTLFGNKTEFPRPKYNPKISGSRYNNSSQHKSSTTPN